MAFHDLIVRERKKPSDPPAIMDALRGLATRMHSGTHYETTENRTANIGVTKGLIQQFFVAQVPPVLGHGAALVLDLENAIRRSKIESSRYEFKQGLLRLDGTREPDPSLLPRLVETACGMANLGPDADGNIFVGVADKQADADRVANLDGVVTHRVASHFIVGVDREATHLKLSLDNYVQRLVGAFQQSQLSEPLKTQILGAFDTIAVHGLSVVRIVVPRQKALSFVGNRAFTRQGSSTIEISGPQLVAAAKLFPN
jgi:hypothetical protein